MAEREKKTGPEEMWELMRELRDSQKETDRLLKDSQKSADRRSREDRKSFEELRRHVEEISERGDQRSKETDRRMRELNELFTGQWGKLMEALVKGDLVRLLNERNIPVVGLARESSRKSGNIEYEFDIIAVNGE